MQRWTYHFQILHLSTFFRSSSHKVANRTTVEYSENKIAQIPQIFSIVSILNSQYRSSPLIAKTRSEWHVTGRNVNVKYIWWVHQLNQSNQSKIKSIKNSQSAACMFYCMPSEKQLAVWVTRRHIFHLRWLPMVFWPRANWFRNRAMAQALRNLRVSHA